MASGLTDYDRAFVQVVEAAWREARESDPATADEAVFPDRRGQLDRSDPDEFALHDTYAYQRHHADAFGRALEYAGIESPRPERPLVVVDIGAGACTVAVALGEKWMQELPNVYYYAIEPHSMMRALGMQLLDELDWPFGHVQVVEKTDELLDSVNSCAPERIDSARLIVTFNYVMQQSSVGQDAVSEWAEFLQHMVACKSDVELLIVTAETSSLDDKTDALLLELSELEIICRGRCDHSFSFDSRYPDWDSLSLESPPVSGIWVGGPAAKAVCRSYVLSAAWAMTTQLSLIEPAGTTEAPAAAAPEGLVYRDGFLSEERERELLTWIDGEESSAWLGDLARRVQHYGYKYDYGYRGIDTSAHLGPLPPWLETLGRDVVSSAADLCHPIETFDQAIVNEYLPGQGIAPHIDRDCFGPVVATVSLNSDVVMGFVGPQGERYSHTLQRRSLVLLTGAAREDWRHGIAKRKNDRDPVSGQVIPRERRVSITFRTVLQGE